VEKPFTIGSRLADFEALYTQLGDGRRRRAALQ
jgi:hypothetical protein